MAEYIEFVLIDNHNEERNVRMNADDPNEVYIWRVKGNRGMLKNPYWKRCVISDRVDGYYVLTITHKKYLLHRVCYYAHNPDWDIYDYSPSNFIDHKDRNPANNHISNLREATNSQNIENNDAKGYSYYKRDKRWVAHIAKDGKTYRKYCKTEEEAIAAREKLKATHHSF